MNFTNDQIVELKRNYYCHFPSAEQLNKAVDFRIPEKGEVFVSNRALEESECLGVMNLRFPNRLIIKKIEKYVDGDTGYNISVKEIYGRDKVLIPSGYEFVRFGIPKKDELVLDLVGGNVFVASSDWFSDLRIILKKNER